MDAINRVRLRVWGEQPDDFFDEAVIDADGTLAPTDAWCKGGVDIAYDGTWCYHPLLISLANTGEPLFLVNRSGNRPSHEQAAEYLDKAIALCRIGGASARLPCGRHRLLPNSIPGRWTPQACGFSSASMRCPISKSWPRTWTLKRTATWNGRLPTRCGRSRGRPAKTTRLRSSLTASSSGCRRMREEVAEFEYQPYACRKKYRVIVLRQLVSKEKGQLVLFEEYRYFFFITNDRIKSAPELVLEANQRCNQENLVAQLKSGVHALTNPVDTLVSNWAYMVMAAWPGA